jgi:hypothetical protein
VPHFSQDHTKQQKDGGRVHQQQRHDHVVGRQNRREVGENDKGGKGGQQREADREWSEHPCFRSLCRRNDKRGFGAGSLFYAH